MSIFRKITLPILLLAICEVVLILLFPWSLIFESTLTAGGDTPSHFVSAAMNDGLRGFCSPVTWVHGAYAGFPFFLLYFPLPFALTALVSKVVSIQIAFKLVTLLAIIPLPAAVYLCLRRLGYGQNTPAIGAVLSLPFLMMTENSMWGGNICSTLSGEFAFGISFILYILLTGKLYADFSERKSTLGDSALEALMALSHGYPLLQSVMGSYYFILCGRNMGKVLKLHLAAAGFAAFWLLPLLWRIPWNTTYSYSWHFTSWAEIAPPLLWPSFAGTLMLACSFVRSLFRTGRKLSSVFRESIECPELYLLWQFGIALLGFSLARSVGLVDIRFLPFAQIVLVLLGAVGWERFLSGLPRPNLWRIGFCVGVIALAMTKAAFVDTWIQWNYSGMESKPLWHSYRLLTDYLKGNKNSPRVAFEHNQVTNNTGSPRAFELLPYFAGRSTLEGLYMQASLNSPFVFYMQSELTQLPSSPFPLYHYSRPDPGHAAAHLRLFNTSQVISASDNIANALDFSPEYEFETAFPPYRIYRVKNCGNSYVEPLRFEPLRISSRNWKKVQFEWFRKSSLRVPLVVASEDRSGEYWKALKTYDGNPERIPEIPIPQDETTEAGAVLGDGKITINTSHPGHPLWIRVSYHPDWRITEGEGELYLASPAFMILVPKTPRVVLTFDTSTGIYLWGKILFFVTILVFLFDTVLGKVRGKDLTGCALLHPSYEPRSTQKSASVRIAINAGLIAALALMAAIILWAISTRNYRDPVLLYDLATSEFERIKVDKSSPEGLTILNSPALSASPQALQVYNLFDECITKFRHSSVADFCMLYKANLMFFQERWDELRSDLEVFLKNNPDNRIQAGAFMWMGEASLKKGEKADAERYFRQALLCWPEDGATRQAGLRLAEMVGAGELFDTARGLLTSGKYLEAYNIYQALGLSHDKKIAEESTIFLAYCSFYMNRWQEASDLYIKWLNDNFDSPESVRVQADYRQCQTIIAQNEEWMGVAHSPSASSVRHGLIVRFLDWLGFTVRREANGQP